MNRIVRIISAFDNALLQYNEGLAKKLNWLTGKDNFFFAKLFIIIAGVWAALMHSLSQNYLTAFSEMLFAWIIFNIIYQTEKEFDKASFRGVLSKFTYDRIRLYRIVLAISVIVIWIYAIFSGGNIIVEIAVFFETIAFVIALYLASVPKPPFAKSQLKEWLKDLRFTRANSSVPKVVTNSN